jgi:hypothetical protein
VDTAKSLRRTKTITLIALAFALAMPVPLLLIQDWLLPWVIMLPLWLASFVLSLVAVVIGTRAVRRAGPSGASPELSRLHNWTLVAIGTATLGFLAAAFATM